MLYVLAAICPPLALLLCGKPIAAAITIPIWILCALLLTTEWELVPLVLLAIYAWMEVDKYYADRAEEPIEISIERE